MPPVESLQSPAAPPESRDEVAANGRWPGGSLADQVGPVSEAASQKDCSPDIPGLLGIQSILSNLRGNGSAGGLLLGVFTGVFS